MKFIKWLEKHFEDLICCSCLAIIAVSVFSQVVARYIFEVALHWTEEVASICMVWAVYMGAALCVKERFHIRILVAVKALPNRLSRLTIFFADFISLSHNSIEPPQSSFQLELRYNNKLSLLFNFDFLIYTKSW